MLFCILLARLLMVSESGFKVGSGATFTFAGFPTFKPMTFHLLASCSLIAASKAALFSNAC